jgi:hypothetical protein
MHSGSTIPVKCNERPGQWTSKNTNVCDDGRTGVSRKLRRVFEVREGQLEEIDNDQKQCPPEIASAPEVDEAEEQQVVGDEPWCQVQRRCQSGRGNIGLEQTCKVWDLENVEDDPVDGDDDPVQRKRRMVVAVLAPDCAAVVTAFMGCFEGIVDGSYDQDEPGNGCKDLVGEDGVFGVGRSLTERVCY